MNVEAIFAVMNTTWAVVKIRPEINSGLYKIWTHDLCDTSAVLYQLSCQANWELLIINREVMNKCLNISKSYVWTVKKEVDMKVIYAVMNTNWAVVEITQHFQNLNRHSRNTLTPTYFKF